MACLFGIATAAIFAFLLVACNGGGGGGKPSGTCKTSFECAEGERCVHGMCKKRGVDAGIDAGEDAGPSEDGGPDAAGPDGGPGRDAGPDAGDAGKPDAGKPPQEVLVEGDAIFTDYMSGPIMLNVLKDGQPLQGVPEFQIGSPGSFSVRVPVEAGILEVSGYNDRNNNGIKDSGEAKGKSEAFEVANENVSGVIVILKLGTETNVVLMGQILFQRYRKGAIVVSASSTENPDRFSEVKTYAGPGDYLFSVPKNTGEVEVSAFNDYDSDMQWSYAGNEPFLTESLKVRVGETEITDADVIFNQVIVSGLVAHPQFGGGNIIVDAKGANGGVMHAQIYMTSPGGFSLLLPYDLGDIEVYGFDDLNGNLAPDEGEPAGYYSESPFTVGTEDINGVLLRLSSGDEVVIAGNVVKEDWVAHPLIVRAFSPLDGTVFSEETKLEEGPGAFTIDHVPANLDEVYLEAFNDLDENGQFDAEEGEPLATSRVPFGIGAEDVFGKSIVFDLIELSGVVSHPLHDGGPIYVAAATNEFKYKFGGATLSSEGQFSFKVSKGIGDIDVYAHNDVNGNMTMDEDEPRMLQPATVTDEDVSGITLALSEIPSNCVLVSGTVSYPEYAGGDVCVSLFGDAELRNTLRSKKLSGPSAWSMIVEKNSGNVWAVCYVDVNGNGNQEYDEPWAAYNGNPLNIGSQNVEHVTLNLGVRPHVNISGTVVVGGDQSGKIWIFGGPDLGNGATALATNLIDSPGSYSLAVPKNAGSLNVFAINDTLNDGIDANDPHGGYSGNPISVGQTDISGIDIELGQSRNISISGTVAYPEYQAGSIVVYATTDSGGENIVAPIFLDQPGEYTIQVQENSGNLWIWAWNDVNGDQFPNPSEPNGAYQSNPVIVGSQDISGIDIALSSSVAVRGTVSYAGYQSGTIAVYGTSGSAVDSPVVTFTILDQPGAYELNLGKNSGNLWVAAFNDRNGNGEPDGAEAWDSYSSNPVNVGTQDISGVNIVLQ